MKHFNSPEFKEELFLCCMKPRYKVGVFSKDSPTSVLHFTYAKSEIELDNNLKNCVSRIINHTAERAIIFTNGSYMRFLSNPDNTRGLRFHKVLCDVWASSDIRVRAEMCQDEYLEPERTILF